MHCGAVDILQNIPRLDETPLLIQILGGNVSSIMLNKPSKSTSWGDTTSTSMKWGCVEPSLVRRVISLISEYFLLNGDQVALLNRVGNWFTTPSKPEGDVVVVHGVFGSGKSHALAAVLLMISILCNGQCKSLVCSCTNVAVDRILTQVVEDLESGKWKQHVNQTTSCDTVAEATKVVRVGCATRVDSRLWKHLVLQAESIGAAKKALVSSRKNANDPIHESLIKEVERNDFMGSQRRKLNLATIVGTTCASSTLSLLHGMKFDVLILDEASQITEPTALLPIVCSRATKMILVGDPKQLPPIVADSRRDSPLNITLFDRLLQNDWPSITLRTQYRCHPDIAEICNRLFYQGNIRNGVDPRDRNGLILNLPPVAIIQHSGSESRIDSSYINAEEASILRELIHHMLEVWKVRISIGIICFYRPQMQHVLKILNPFIEHLKESQSEAKLTVSTVDAFQGQENDISIILTTRSGDSSFLSDIRRVNVAISRSKHHLMILGQKALFESSEFWQSISQGSLIVSSFSQLIEYLGQRERESIGGASYTRDCIGGEGTSIRVPYKRKSVSDIEESLSRLNKLRKVRSEAI